MVDIIASYHRIQFEGKFMIQTQENDEKPHFGSYLGPLPQIRAANFLFFSSEIWLCQLVDIMVNYHYVQYQKKLMIQS